MAHAYQRHPIEGAAGGMLVEPSLKTSSKKGGQDGGLTKTSATPLKGLQEVTVTYKTTATPLKGLQEVHPDGSAREPAPPH